MKIFIMTAIFRKNIKIASVNGLLAYVVSLTSTHVTIHHSQDSRNIMQKKTADDLMQEPLVRTALS